MVKIKCNNKYSVEINTFSIIKKSSVINALHTYIKYIHKYIMKKIK